MSRLRRWLPAVPEDGTVGLLVGLHWTRWLRFWIGAPLLLTACIVTFLALRRLGVLDGWAETPTWIVALILGALPFKVTVLWYRAVRAACVVVTRVTIYRSRIEKWFWRVVDPFPIDGGWFESHVEGWGLLGVRTLLFTLEGDLPEIELRHSNLGADGIRRLHRLTSPITLPYNDRPEAPHRIDRPCVRG